MTRQECVIRIAKINKVFGELKYRIDIGAIPDLAAYAFQLLMVNDWTADIQQYISQEFSPTLARQIVSIGYTEEIEKFLREHNTGMAPAYATALEESVKKVRSLMGLCRHSLNKEKGLYSDLIEPLANEQTVALMQRAVDAGLLDIHFQPSSKATTLQLRVIAFAVSSMCKLPHMYAPFEN